tara:strand:+ start:2354 stop:2557 length:204 start_codon:yes stop_codon:yes gene_type:complete
MKLPIGQLIKITLDERDPPLLAIVTDDFNNGAYELTWSAEGRMISTITSHDQLVDKFSHGYYKLVLE